MLEKSGTWFNGDKYAGTIDGFYAIAQVFDEPLRKEESVD